jgi:hypothetical protein
LEIVDDSTSHSEHEAMRDNGYNETHFKVLVVSDAFKSKVNLTFINLAVVFIFLVTGITTSNGLRSS